MIEAWRRGGVSSNNVHRIIVVEVVLGVDNGAHLYFFGDILFMFQQEKYFCLKLVTFSNLQWKRHKIFFLESYKGRRKIMTLLFTIYKSLAEIFNFFEPVFSCLHKARNSDTYLWSWWGYWVIPIRALSIISSIYLILGVIIMITVTTFIPWGQWWILWHAFWSSKFACI